MTDFTFKPIMTPLSRYFTTLLRRIEQYDSLSKKVACLKDNLAHYETWLAAHRCCKASDALTPKLTVYIVRRELTVELLRQADQELSRLRGDLVARIATFNGIDEPEGEAQQKRLITDYNIYLRSFSEVPERRSE